MTSSSTARGLHDLVEYVADDRMTMSTKIRIRTTG